MSNNLVSQAATMSTHGVPNDILSNLDPIALIIFIPICDLLVSNTTLVRLFAFLLTKCRPGIPLFTEASY